MASESLTVVRKREKMGCVDETRVCRRKKEREKDRYERRMIFCRRDLDFVFFAHFADGTTGGLGS